MANWTLSAPDLRMLVDIMTRSELFDTPTQRKNFFTYSGYADVLPKLQSDLSLTDTTSDFCKTLVRQLKEGLLPDGSHHTLYLLLGYLQAEIVNGHSIEKSLVEKWMEESEVAVRQPSQLPIPETTEVNLETVYDEALSAFFDEQWEEVLRLVSLLESQAYNDSHRMTKVADMKQDATEEWAKVKRQREYEADYRHVAMLTRKQERLPRAKQAWATFLQKHRENFSPERDPKALALFFDQQYLLSIMYELDLPPTERAKAGRDLAEIGDPRPEVMDIDAMHFCWIPAGRFWMGSVVEEDPLSYDDERPADWFTIPYGYWMGRFPITNEQYQEFVEATGGKNCPENYGVPYTLSNHPVVGVTWHQALAFTRWLTVRWQEAGLLPIGWQVMLPNEPEWEKAARGGETFSPASYMLPIQLRTPVPTTWQPNPLSQRRYPDGNYPNPNRSNYDKSGIKSTSAVGTFRGGSSPYGCEEMSGNVWEWCRSAWDDAYPFTIERDDLTLQGVHRVLRGGSFKYSEKHVRCACRGNYHPDQQINIYGFRVVVVPVSP